MPTDQASADEVEPSRGRGIQLALFRRMSPEQKLRAASKLYWSARQLRAAGFKAAHPDWTDARVEKAVRDAFLFHREY